jgi:hypothetical protein
MSLTLLEREAVNDSVLKIQSINSSLRELSSAEVPDLKAVRECLAKAHTVLRKLLQDSKKR